MVAANMKATEPESFILALHFLSLKLPTAYHYTRSGLSKFLGIRILLGTMKSLKIPNG
jgi:hypothetical protein